MNHSITKPKSRFKESYIKDMEEMAADGKTIDEIAFHLNVDRKTIFRWAKKFEGVQKALKTGREFAAQQVIQTLFKRAIGYDVEETRQIGTTSGFDKDGKPKQKMQIEKTTRHIPGDVGAACFLLKNLCPNEWRDRWDIQQTGNINITYDQLMILDKVRQEKLTDDSTIDVETT